jgi:hypothetical protein
MKNLIFSLFAIGVAAIAAMTATTAMLNAPRRTVAPAIVTAMQPQQVAPTPGDGKPATAQDAPPATPGGNADHGKPATGTNSGKGAAGKDDDEGDKDPYEGVAPEEIPPDMQYSADSSVSFPTNI